MYKKFCSTKNRERKEKLFSDYKKYKNTLANVLQQSKDTYYKSYFLDNKKNAVKIWQGIKQIINFNPKVKCSPTSILKNKELITNTKEIAEHFNEYFTSIAQTIDEKIIPTNKNYKDYISDLKNVKTFAMNPVTPEEVRDYILRLLVFILYYSY